MPTFPSVPAPTLPSVPTTPTPELPDFIVLSVNWIGQCTNNSCTQSATFRNIGGDGNAAAIFHVIPFEGGADLADCSVTIPYTTAQGTTGAECTASSADLALYFATHRNVRGRATVNNPY